MSESFLRRTFFVVVALFLFGMPGEVAGHCDSLAGPVVGAARAALETATVTPALRWVRATEEDEVRRVFERTLSVRRLGPEARELADRYFFETLVRLHRLGEGESYTGLRDEEAVAPVVGLVDSAIATGDIDHLVNHVAAEVASELRARLALAMERRKTADETVEAGRAYVAAYVALVHYVETLHSAGAAAPDHR